MIKEKIVVTIDQLTPYHREKIMKLAFEYRAANYARIVVLIKNSSVEVRHHPPTGTQIFDPEKWTGHHWLWYSEILTEQVKARMR